MARLRESFWFIPSLMVIASAGLAVAMTEVDARVARELLVQWPRLFGAGADGSRAMLSAIASSMMTVATVTFSITMLALSQAAAQYSPRVLRRFTSDRAIQTVLGVFVGVFVYCLTVLRTISGGDKREFLPSLSVTLAGVLALLAIGFLVYFIHHIALSLQASTIIASVGRETLRSIDRVFPHRPSDIPDAIQRAELVDFGAAAPTTVVGASKTGYIESIDTASILETAAGCSAYVTVVAPVGSFVVEGEPVARIASSAVVPMHALRALADAVTVSEYRSNRQDPGFGIQQLVDIALKALSPGVNDPTTAVMALHYLGAIARSLAERTIEPDRCSDPNGRMRVLVPVPSFGDYVEMCFAPVLTTTQNPTVLRAVATAVSRAAGGVVDDRRRPAVISVLDRLKRVSLEIGDPSDKAVVERAVGTAYSIVGAAEAEPTTCVLRGAELLL